MEMIIIVLAVIAAAFALLAWRRRGQGPTSNWNPTNPRNDGGNRTHGGGGGAG
jgi:hypothetical protein